LVHHVAGTPVSDDEGCSDMKLGTLIVSACVAGLVVSSALATPPTGKGKPDPAAKQATTGKPAPTGANCRPKVMVVLKGKLTSASTVSLAMSVSSANHWGRAWATLGAATVAIDTTTTVRRNGKKLVTDLVAGDRLLVQAKACKADLTSSTAPALTGLHVVAHPAKA
jgi:hypothetical protein